MREHADPSTTQRSTTSFAMRLIVSLVAVVLLMGPYLANLSTRPELLGRQWRTSDAWFLLLLIMMAGTIWATVGELLERTHRRFLTRVFDHCFVVAVGAGVLANISFYLPMVTKHGMMMETAWLLLIGSAAYSLAGQGSTLVLRTRQGCQMLSPVLVMIPIQMLGLDTYPSESDPLRAPIPVREIASSNQQSPVVGVYIFVFDMWSYERTFGDTRFDADLEHLDALTARSIVFDDAHSPAPGTMQSMPRFLFDTSLEAVYDGGEVGFERDGSMVATSEFPSLFDLSSAGDHLSYLVGFALPYSLWLGDRVDTCRAYRWCQWYPGEGVLERAGTHLFRAMRYWTDPWSRTIHSRLHAALDGLWAIRIHRSIVRDVLHCIQAQPPNTLALFHIPVPHYPYMLREEGGYRRPMDVGWDYENLAEYERALLFLDEEIGRYVAAMKAAGRFDDALVIMTSDHEWKFDPRRKAGRMTSPLTHVPLIVKLPGQEKSVRVSSHFETRNLRVLIDFVLRGGRDAAGLDLLKKLSVEADTLALLPGAASR